MANYPTIQDHTDAFKCALLEGKNVPESITSESSFFEIFNWYLTTYKANALMLNRILRYISNRVGKLPKKLQETLDLMPCYGFIAEFLPMKLPATDGVVRRKPIMKNDILVVEYQIRTAVNPGVETLIFELKNVSLTIFCIKYI